MSSSGINNFDPKRFRVDSNLNGNKSGPIKPSVHGLRELTNVLNVENVSKMYLSPAGEFTALKDINFSVKKGELVSIVGPSGSGKSTLLNIIGALDKPTSGNVLVDGIDIFALPSKEISNFRNRMIGFIFQSYNLINRTSIQKNIEIPGIISGMSKTERKLRSNKLLDILGMGDKADQKPLNLSGGQQQRVAIARSLMNYPEIILADEPTGNLDTKTGEEVFYLLKSLSKRFRRTIILVTHNLELSKETDRTIHIKDGKLEKDVVN
jgi:putative ABC transport system ATP-binding protein